MMNSNLNLAKPIIILMTRELKGWDAVNRPNQSKLTQSCCEKWNAGKPTLTPPVSEITRCGDHYRAYVPISIFSNHSLYL